MSRMILDPDFPLQFQLHIDDEMVDAREVSIYPGGFDLHLLKAPKFQVSDEVHKFTFEFSDGSVVEKEGQITRIEPVIVGPNLPISVVMHVLTSIEVLDGDT